MIKIKILKNSLQDKQIIFVTTTVVVLSAFLLTSMVTSSFELANADRINDAKKNVKDRLSEAEQKLKDRLNKDDNGGILNSPGNTDAFSNWDSKILPDIYIRG